MALDFSHNRPHESHSVILILSTDTNPDSDDFRALISRLNEMLNIEFGTYEILGAERNLMEIYLVGDTASLYTEDMQALLSVQRMARVLREYRALGRHADDHEAIEFVYNGVRFSQDNLHAFAGLRAVNTPEHAEEMMRPLNALGLNCTRMGAYKPRTSPDYFQGHDKHCLPHVFELAGKSDMKAVAMEVTHESYVDEIHDALEATGQPTGVMLQLGTRNLQNPELLKFLGRQQEFPGLVKRGFGMTL